MGSLKDQMMDDMENNRNKKIAELLGITEDDLALSTWELEERTNNDGVVLDVDVCFDENTPRRILDKIEGLGEDNCVSIGANSLDEPDEDHEV